MGRVQGNCRIDRMSARRSQRIVGFHSDIDFGVTTHLEEIDEHEHVLLTQLQNILMYYLND